MEKRAGYLTVYKRTVGKKNLSQTPFMSAASLVCIRIPESGETGEPRFSQVFIICSPIDANSRQQNATCALTARERGSYAGRKTVGSQQ